RWFKQVGDSIAADEPIVELETDKVTVEVPAPSAGTLQEISVKEGETVEVGALLGSIGEGAAAPAGKAAEKPAAKAQEKPAEGATAKAIEQTANIGGEPPIEPRDRPPAPSAAKLLAESNLSTDQVAGSGKDGQVLKGDVLAAIEQMGRGA